MKDAAAHSLDPRADAAEDAIRTMPGTEANPR